MLFLVKYNSLNLSYNFDEYEEIRIPQIHTLVLRSFYGVFKRLYSFWDHDQSWYLFGSTSQTNKIKMIHMNIKKVFNYIKSDSVHNFTVKPNVILFDSKSSAKLEYVSD